MEKNPLQQQQEKVDVLRQELKINIGKVFDSPQEINSKAEKIVSELDSYEKAGLVFDKEKIIKEAKECLNIKDRESFILHLSRILDPLIILRVANPAIFEKIKREELSNDGNLKLSEVLYAGTGEDPEGVYIHLPPSTELIKEKGLGGFKREIEKGLVQLAEIVRFRPDIKTIYAISWIVAKNPLLLKKLGFAIKGEISEEERRRNFAQEEKPVAEAFMTREDFLTKYGN